MNTPVILKLSAALLLGCGSLVQAAADEPSSETQAENRADNLANSSASAAIGASTSGGEGTVTYNGKEVWKGKVSKELNTIARSTGDKGYDGDYAAAWDGKKLVWENVKGAGDKLKGELRKLRKKQKKL